MGGGNRFGVDSWKHGWGSGGGEPKGRKGNKLFINVHHCGNWNSVLLGASEKPQVTCFGISFPRQKGWASFWPLGCRPPLRTLSPARIVHFCAALACSRESSPGIRKSSHEEKRGAGAWGWGQHAGNCPCSCQWTWAWRHIITLFLLAQNLHSFLYLKDLQIGSKLWEGKKTLLALCSGESSRWRTLFPYHRCWINFRWINE